jgi:hypothetical protein
MFAVLVQREVSWTAFLVRQRSRAAHRWVVVVGGGELDMAVRERERRNGGQVIVFWPDGDPIHLLDVKEEAVVL